MKKLEHGLVTFSYLVLEIGLVASRSDLNSSLKSELLLLKKVEGDCFRSEMTKLERIICVELKPSMCFLDAEAEK